MSRVGGTAQCGEPILRGASKPRTDQLALYGQCSASDVNAHRSPYSTSPDIARALAARHAITDVDLAQSRRRNKLDPGDGCARLAACSTSLAAYDGEDGYMKAAGAFGVNVLVPVPLLDSCLFLTFSLLASSIFKLPKSHSSEA